MWLDAAFAILVLATFAALFLFVRSMPDIGRQ
jgi:hypothetical protein